MRRFILEAGLLCALLGVLYGRFLTLPLTTSDIFPLIAAHRAHSLSGVLHSLEQRLMEGYFTARFYRPVTQLSYALDSWLWGLEPFGYHLTHLLLHLWTTLWLYALARRLFAGQPRAAFLAAVLFLTFAGHLDIVPGLDRRADMLMGAALVTSLACLARAVGAPEPVCAGKAGSSLHLPWYLASLVMAGAALGAKEPGIAVLALFPVVLLGVDRAGTTGSRLRRAVLLTLPAVVVDLALLAMRARILGTWGGGYGRVLSPQLFGSYLVELLSDYAPPEVVSRPLEAVPDLVATAALILLILLGIARAPGAGAEGSSRWVLLLSAVWIGSFGAIYGLMASYAPWHLYAPSAGFALGVAACIALLWDAAGRARGRARLARALVVLALLGYAVRTRDLVRDRSWEDGGRAMQDAIDATVARLGKVPDRAVLYLANYPARITYDRAARRLSRWNSGLYEYTMRGVVQLYQPDRGLTPASISYVWLEDPSDYRARGRLEGRVFEVSVQAGGGLRLRKAGREPGAVHETSLFRARLHPPARATVQLKPPPGRPAWVLTYVRAGRVQADPVQAGPPVKPP